MDRPARPGEGSGGRYDLAPPRGTYYFGDSIRAALVEVFRNCTTVTSNDLAAYDIVHPTVPQKTTLADLTKASALRQWLLQGGRCLVNNHDEGWPPPVVVAKSRHMLCNFPRVASPTRILEFHIGNPLIDLEHDTHEGSRASPRRIHQCPPGPHSGLPTAVPSALRKPSGLLHLDVIDLATYRTLVLRSSYR
ncbi:MAG: hypothetical protein ACYDEY_13345 [Acidimicrobiales bacterium]